MLPTWNPNRLVNQIPFVAAAVGGRRQGKSTLQLHLLELMSKRFDLVVSFMGTSACSPGMRKLLETSFDPRFVFAEWNQPLMDALMAQQERLKLAGQPRQVCILVDDIILSGRDEDSLSHLCLRGRHFNISVLACAVSYTTLPKRCRRSLDVLFLYSCPMAGDIKTLTHEYASQASLARYCLQNLEEYTCLVMETLQRRQKLYFYRVELGSGHQTRELSSPDQSETVVSAETPEPNQTLDHPVENADSPDSTLDQENEGSYGEE